MKFLAVFLFLFSTTASAGDVKLVCNVSGKYFDGKKTQEYKFTFNDSEERICKGYPCKRADTYKINETISYAGYKNAKASNTVQTWSKDIIEFGFREGGTTGNFTLDRTSGTLSYVFMNRDFEVRVNLKGPCEVIKKFDNEKASKF
ncbi:hypothetical protein [Microbulbifer sp. TYP-18]|uniref:hypothetical protein n=1 Tax=Microbulbifer sp. TYP-18 TaxID=3230024 RepID=UPI0034C5F1AB